MIDIRSALITASAMLVLLGLGYWILVRRTRANGDNEREQTEEDLKMEADGASRRERVGFVGRARVQPTTTLLFFGCVGAFLLVAAVAVYQVAKTGSPSEMKYADQINYAISALVFLGAGVWFKSHQDGKAGELNITYEGEETNVTDTHYYDKSLVQPLFDDDGNRDALLVPIFKQSRILGLFWMPKLIADDWAARDVEKNLPEDQVTYEVPLDQSATWNQDVGRINVRAKTDDPVRNPKRRATYEFVPSDRKSEAEIQDIQDENEQLRQQVEHEQRMNGVATEQLDQYQEALENREHGSLGHLNESFGMFLQIMQAIHPQQGNGTGNGDGDAQSVLDAGLGDAGKPGNSAGSE